MRAIKTNLSKVALFVKRFFAEKKEAQLELWVTSNCTFYVNGKLICHVKHKSNPIPNIRFSHQYNLELQAGENVVFVLAKDDFALKILAESQILCTTDESWAVIPIQEKNPGEQYDLRDFPRDWMNPDVAESAMAVYSKSKVKVLKSEAERLNESLVKPVAFVEMPCAITAPSGIEISCQIKKEVSVCYFEFIKEQDGEILLHSYHDRYTEPSVSIDGESCSIKKKYFLKAGQHRMVMVVYQNPDLFLEGEGLKRITGYYGYVIGNRSTAYPWNTKERFPNIEQNILELHEKYGRQRKQDDACWSELLEIPSSRYAVYLRQKKGEVIEKDWNKILTGADATIPSDVTFILDFGQVLCGYLSFEIDALSDLQIDLIPFETIDELGPYFLYTNYCFSCTLGKGKTSFSSLERYGCRYVAVTIHTNEACTLAKLMVTNTRIETPFEGIFSCDEEQLNQIYQMCLKTVHLCMYENYVDCPTWEQNFWTGDMVVPSHVNLLSLGAYGLDRHCVRYAGEMLTDDYIKMIHPQELRFVNHQYLTYCADIPMWSFVCAFQIRNYFYYTGDFAVLREQYQVLRKNVSNALHMLNERGLLVVPEARNLFDWACNDLNCWGEVTGNSALLCENISICIELASYLGIQEPLLLEKKKELVEAINKYCWDVQREAYVDTVRDATAYEKEYLPYCEKENREPLSMEQFKQCTRVSEHTAVLMLLCDCVSEDRKEKTEKILRGAAEGIFNTGAPRDRSDGMPSEKEAPGGIVRTGTPFFLYFTLNAMYKCGMYEEAEQLMRKAWGKLLKDGYDTAAETFDFNKEHISYPFVHRTRSSVHAWSTAPAVYFITEIVGIQPIQPGWKKFTVKPHLGSLSKANASVVTPYGAIYVSLQKCKDRIKISIQSPEECEYIPIEKENSVYSE